MKIRSIIALALPLLAAPLAISVQPAQAQVIDRVLVIYGDDPCPTNASGDEIVVCARRPESERYRIPKELRPRSQSPEATSWAARSQSTLDSGASGTGSCSTVGGGGWTGCWAEQMRAAKKERQAKAAERREEP
jgi:hypothetical protein